MNVLIFGGAGFIGCNVADYYLSCGDSVTVFDNFSRQGTRNNLQWLQSKYASNLQVVEADIRFCQNNIEKAVNKSDVVFHFAAQVAVTTSVTNPREDFDINALGTFNILEAIRVSASRPIMIFASTNKVYGCMARVATIEREKRYEYATLHSGVSEEQPLDFHSPYGCSKGAGEQYVRDYARIYGLRTVVFRQSCIYGYRQFGVEDQGGVAHFTISAALHRRITIYGNGKQVRDLLFTTDLIKAYDLALEHIDVTTGQVYNIGGGPANTLSLLALVEMLQRFFEKPLEYRFSDWRPGDQPIFVCDIASAKKDFGWQPAVGVEEGVGRLAEWVKQNSQELRSILL